MAFSQTHDWISTKPTAVGNCTHCCISHSKEIKYIADNSSFITEEQTKQKRRNNTEDSL